MSQASNTSVPQDAAAAGRTPRSGAPAGFGYAVTAGVAVLLAGALYLIAVRGEALIVDLGKLGRIFCF